MPLVLRDRVKETTTTTGTGTVTLAGAVTGFQSFSAIGNANTTYYCIAGQSGSEWEVGVGTYTSAGTTLSRDTVFASSNAGALVTFSAGTKDVFCTYAATNSVYENAAGNVDGYLITGGSINNTPIGGTTPNSIIATTIDSATNPTNTVPAVHLSGTPNGAAGGKVGVLAIGPDFTASDKNIIASLTQDINDYTQIIVQNPNAGSSASADIVVNNDNTTGAGVYGDFGINSSNYVGTGPFSLADATYLYSQGGDLVIGTQSANAIRFVANNASSDAATFSSGGILTLATPLALGSGGTGKGSGNAALTELAGFTTTATSGGTTALTNTSTNKQFFTGTLNQTITLPSTATLAQGWSFHIVNFGTGVLTVQTSTAVSLGTVPAGTTAMPTAVTITGNAATDWEFGLTDFSNSTGTGAVVLNSSPSVNFLSLGAGTASSPPLSMASGTNISAVAAGAVEYDGVVFYKTPNTVSGRGFTPTRHIFRLAANVTAFGPAIGNFFGANSAINLVGGGTYEIDIFCYFTKTTAGTVVVTATSSLAPVSLSGVIQTGAVTGGTATGVAQQIALFNSTATAAAFGATGSLTTAVNHAMQIRLIVEANASNSNLRINFTSSAGTVTPLRTSYYKVTRLPAANTGSFAA